MVMAGKQQAVIWNVKKIYSKSIVENESSIDVSNQPKGIYFYKISDNYKVIKSGKLIDWIREQLHKIFRIGKKAELKLRGEIIVLKGFKWKKIRYVKRLPADATKLLCSKRLECSS